MVSGCVSQPVSVSAFDGDGLFFFVFAELIETSRDRRPSRQVRLSLTGYDGT